MKSVAIDLHNGGTLIATEPPAENGWTRAKEWPGNPSLNMLCSFKIMRTVIGRKKVPVLVYGGGPAPYEKWGNYCVCAGRDSDLSHSGFAPGCVTEVEVQDYIDKKFSYLQ